MRKSEFGFKDPWALDTMLFIYHIDAHPDYSFLTSKLFQKIEQGIVSAYTSTITLMELCHQPYKKGNDILAGYYRKLITDFPNLKTIEVNLDIAQYSAWLASKY